MSGVLKKACWLLPVLFVVSPVLAQQVVVYNRLLILKVIYLSCRYSGDYWGLFLC